jgi:hypothetical protein
VLEDPNAEA